MKAVFVYKKPKLALAAVMSLVFVLVIAAASFDHIEKFGFLVATGLGVYFIVTAGKAIRNEFGNLGVLLLFCGLAMLTAGLFATPATVLASSSVEDLVPSIVGALGGVFTSVEDDPVPDARVG